MTYVILLISIFAISFLACFLIDKLLRFILFKIDFYKSKDKHNRMIAKIMHNNKLSVIEKANDILDVVELKLKYIKRQERKEKLKRLNGFNGL